MVAGANRSFRWKRGFDVHDRCCRSWTTHPLYWQPRRRDIVWEKAGPSIGCSPAKEPKKHDENIPRHPADRSGVGDVKTSRPHRQTNRPRA